MDHETAEEIKRHFTVVAEGLRTDFRAVVEGLGPTDKLDRIESRIDDVETRMAEVETQMAGLLKRLTQEFGEVKGMIRLSLR